MELRKICYSILVLSVLSVICAEKARYDNYRIYKLLIENEEQLNLLRDIDDYGVSVVHATNVLI